MKAQHRLSSRYRKLTARGKSPLLAVTAVARELLGFIWAIHVERQHETGLKRKAG
jgi:transposase